MSIFDFNTRLRTAEFMRDLIPKVSPGFERYVDLYSVQAKLTTQPIDETIAEMSQSGVTRGAIRATNAEELELVYKTCRKYPGIFYGFAGIHAHVTGAGPAVKDLEKAFTEYGMYGLSLGPYLTGIYPTDRRNYPLYALCENMGKPVVFHCATHFNTYMPLDISDPKYIDEVAVDFPNLKIVLGHAGTGFGAIPLIMAHRHRNMYLDFSALVPQHQPKEVIFAMNTYLRKKTLYGTAYPLVDSTIVHAWKKMIMEDNQPYFFYKNAEKLLGLTKPKAAPKPKAKAKAKTKKKK
jgi:uncharacterized protein